MEAAKRARGCSRSSWPNRVSAQPREPTAAAPMLRRKLSAAVVFVAIVAGPVWLRCWWCRLASGWIAHQPIEIRPRPQYDVILRHELAMIALATYVLPEPVADLTRVIDQACEDPNQCDFRVARKNDAAGWQPVVPIGYCWTF